MGTRATYQFTTPEDVTVCVYIHWDGYPQGAADYLAAALEHARLNDISPNSSLAEWFIAATKCMLTPGHDAHGDTEFQYNFRFAGGTYHVTAIDVYHEKKMEYTLEQFMSLYTPVEWIRIVGNYRGSGIRCENQQIFYMPLDKAMAVADDLLSTFFAAFRDGDPDQSLRYKYIDKAREAFDILGALDEAGHHEPLRRGLEGMERLRARREERGQPLSMDQLSFAA